MICQKWDILRANLDPVIGSEQGKSRPVMVISEDDINELLNAINIVPITTLKKSRTIYPNEVLFPFDLVGLENDSIARCNQIRTIEKKRLSKKYDRLTDKTLQKKIIEAIKFQLGID